MKANLFNDDFKSYRMHNYHKSVLQDLLSNKRFQIFSAAIFIFILYVMLSLRYSYPYINNNSVNVIVEYLRFLYFDTGFSPWEHQINYYTGNPFFIFPIFLLIDPSPFMLRLVLISCMAGATMFAFLSYLSLYDLKKAALGVLILLNMNSWIVFRDGDYTYSVLFPMICLYFYIKWEKENKNYILWSLSFFTGIFFYFKSILAYFALSVLLGKLLDTTKKTLNGLKPREIIVSIIFLLIGTLPFLIYAFKRRLIFLPKALGMENNGIYNEGLSLLDIAKIRFANFSHLIDPDSILNIPNCAGCWNFNIFLGLLALGILISFYRRKNLNYTIAFLSLFILLFHVPHDIRWMQLLVLLPFVPLIILNIFSEFGRYENYAISIGILVLVFGLFGSISELENDSQGFNEPTHWGGTQEAYEDYENLNITNEVIATNSYYVWVLSRYDFSVKESMFLIPRKSDQIRSEWTNFASKGRKSLESIGKTPNKLLLVNNPRCQTSTENCGYNKSEILNKLEIDNYTSEQKVVHGKNLSLVKVLE